MSSVQLASITLEHGTDGSTVRAVLEWRKDAGYAAYLTDVDAVGSARSRDVAIAPDAPSGLRELADLIEAHAAGRTADRHA